MHAQNYQSPITQLRQDKLNNKNLFKYKNEVDKTLLVFINAYTAWQFNIAYTKYPLTASTLTAGQVNTTI